MCVVRRIELQFPYIYSIGTGKVSLLWIFQCSFAILFSVSPPRLRFFEYTQYNTKLNKQYIHTYACTLSMDGTVTLLREELGLKWG